MAANEQAASLEEVMVVFSAFSDSGETQGQSQDDGSQGADSGAVQGSGTDANPLHSSQDGGDEE